MKENRWRTAVSCARWLLVGSRPIFTNTAERFECFSLWIDFFSNSCRSKSPWGYGPWDLVRWISIMRPWNTFFILFYLCTFYIGNRMLTPILGSVGSSEKFAGPATGRIFFGPAKNQELKWRRVKRTMENGSHCWKESAKERRQQIKSRLACTVLSVNVWTAHKGEITVCE